MRASLTIIVAVAALAPTTGALAAGCAPFDAYSTDDGREVTFADLDGSGAPSAGDRRLGVRVLTDADGKAIGKRYWTVIIDGTDAEGEVTSRTVEFVNVFDDGAIFALDQETRPPAGAVDATDKRQVAALKRGATIVGGTGAYAGATGTVGFTPDGMKSAYRFDVTCK